MLNAFLCLTFVAAYLYASAIPQYNRLGWAAGVDFAAPVPFPAFAFLITNQEFTPASSAVEQGGSCSYSTGNSGIAASSSSSPCPNSSWPGTPVSVADSFMAYVFNPLGLPQSERSNLNTVTANFSIESKNPVSRLEAILLIAL